jgi:hypothetical protein
MANQPTYSLATWSVVIDGTLIRGGGLANEECVIIESPQAEATRLTIGVDGCAVTSDVQSRARDLILRVWGGSPAYKQLQALAFAQNDRIARDNTVSTFTAEVSKSVQINQSSFSVTTYYFTAATIPIYPRDEINNANAEEGQMIYTFVIRGMSSGTLA